jgi:hypothetical protein
MTDVFVSYESRDREHAVRLATALESLDISVWWDRQGVRGPTPFDEQIEQALAQAKIVIAIWSVNSAKSTWVRSEAEFARRENKLVCIRLDDTNIPFSLVYTTQ